MRFLMNIIWFVFCGIWQALFWMGTGILWCLSIVGIPVGVQCFKFAGFVLWPFGKEVVYGPGVVSFLINLIWVFFSGVPLALGALCNGIILCLTVIGIPFGLQCFKFAKLSLMPFGSRVVPA